MTEISHDAINAVAGGTDLVLAGVAMALAAP